MKEKIAKTNAARLLDKAKVSYELIPYEVDENDLSAIHVAASLGENMQKWRKRLGQICFPAWNILRLHLSV